MLTAAAVTDNPFYSQLSSRAWWMSISEGDDYGGNPRYKDTGSIPFTVMLSRGLVLLFAVLPLSLPLGFYAYRVAALAKTVHAVGIPPEVLTANPDVEATSADEREQSRGAKQEHI